VGKKSETASVSITGRFCWYHAVKCKRKELVAHRTGTLCDRDSSVSKVTRYELDDQGSDPDKRRDVSPHHRVQPSFGTRSVSCPVFPGMKRQEREADHIPPSSVEVNSVCVELCLHSSIRFHGVVRN
jgi:hypothetical protein